MNLIRKANHSVSKQMSLSLTSLLAFCLIFTAHATAEQITVSGFTESHLDSKLGLSVTGRVGKIYVQEGQQVKKSELLLVLDQRMETLEMERRELIWKSRAEIDAVSRQLKTLESQLKESQSLYEATGSIPREELENQQLEFDLVKIEHKRLEVAEEREKREYGIAKEELQKRTLRAPFDGKVVELFIDVGENCEPDTQLVHLVSTDRVDFVANIELGISEKLELGQSVELQLLSGGSTVNRNAEIVLISPVVDPASGLRTIKARFDNNDGEIIPGITGTMRFNSE